MHYNHQQIESTWQDFWKQKEIFKTEDDSKKTKHYVLDMFPYPSGAGLHVGHPLGYIASDIYARYKRHQGYNVLHPMGYDSFGLPAEQYAIQTGQRPEITTENNIETYRRQLDKVGFSFDWSREVRTSNSNYYKWTQWIFSKLYNSWYNQQLDKAENITSLIKAFETHGNTEVKAACDEEIPVFTSSQWSNFSKKEQAHILAQYRLAFLSETEVNWCPELGTVLANDEVVNGVSERGGFPVVQKKMMQWSMRISAYAQRLLNGLNNIDWPQPLKEAQKNWIGKSEGAAVTFNIQNSPATIEVFTTRPDTIFGVCFITLAPEHSLVLKITADAQKQAVAAYVEKTAKKSERERMADVKTISGVFTGAHAIHPFTKKEIPIWIGDYVLASYGTGAVMAVPAGDQRDWDFATHFNIPILNIFKNISIETEAYSLKEGVLENSDFLNGLSIPEATKVAIQKLEAQKAGKGKINFRLRDAVFSRQRYWGEPFPIYYKDGLPQLVDEKYLPVKLPEVAQYKPTPEGKPPLGNAKTWAWNTETNKVVDNSAINHKTVFPLELNTMPGWAGSSWYFNRFMDPHNNQEFASEKALNYWQNIDLYIGGSEHATGHLLYARFWQHFLFDCNQVPVDEFAKKLINQGMILGESAFAYVFGLYLKNKTNDSTLPSKKYVIPKKSYDLAVNEQYDSLVQKLIDENIEAYKNEGITAVFDEDQSIFSPFRVDLKYLNEASNELNIASLIADPIFEFVKDAEFILDQNNTYQVGREVEKMSKSKHNVVNPDQICDTYGADSLRLFEMFLGPLEQAKPWSTSGISGVHSFLKKLWKLYHSGAENSFVVSNDQPTPDALKTLHKTIKKVTEDIENFSFNTSVSSFMIAVNELTSQKCKARNILEPLAILIAPYAPHIAEALWFKLKHGAEANQIPNDYKGISYEKFPVCNEKYLIEANKVYPVSFNGKMKFTLELPLSLNKQEIESEVMLHEKTIQQLNEQTPKKVIVVPGKIVNIVV